MTDLQVKYQTLMETKRANQALEANKYYVATEQARSNRAQERLTSEKNELTRNMNEAQIAEIHATIPKIEAEVDKIAAEIKNINANTSLTKAKKATEIANAIKRWNNIVVDPNDYLKETISGLSKGIGRGIGSIISS